MKIYGTEFNPDTANFHAGNAYVLGQAAALSYEDAVTIESRTRQWGLSSCRNISVRGTEAFVAANDELVIIAFRGTEPTKIGDWLTDAAVLPVAGPAGQVHSGFLRALNLVWPDVLRAIDALQTKGQSLWFTGHSLGAALATLAVARLRLNEDRAVHGLYTFGQPRTGDREFETRFNLDFKSQCFRYVNNSDVVTRVPTRLTGYSHVGTFVYFDKDGKASADRGFWFRFLDRMEGRLLDIGTLGFDDLKDHSMTYGYLPNLAKLQNPF